VSEQKGANWQGQRDGDENGGEIVDLVQGNEKRGLAAPSF